VLPFQFLQANGSLGDLATRKVSDFTFESGFSLCNSLGRNRLSASS
jgi:hypothetical protein